jgi:PPM family protein phosphatase
VGAPLGSFGAFDGETLEKPRSRRRWFKGTLSALVALGLVGGGLYGAYQWTRTQYYIGVNGDHAAVFQGLSQKLGPISLSKMYKDRTDIELKYLPVFTHKSVTDTIPADSLALAETKAANLSHVVRVCKTKAAIDKAREQAAKAKERQKGKPAATAASGSAPALSTTGTAVPKTTSGTASTAGTGTTASPSPSPTLSPEDQTLAQQCPSGQ